MVTVPSRDEVAKYASIETLLAGFILIFLTCALITETAYVSFDYGFSFGLNIVWHQFPSSIFSTIFTAIVFIYNALIIIFEVTGSTPIWRSNYKQKLIVQGSAMVLIFIVGLMNSLLANKKNDIYVDIYRKRLIPIAIFAWLVFLLQILQLIKYLLEMKNFNFKFGNRNSNSSRTTTEHNTTRVTVHDRSERTNTNDIEVEIDNTLEDSRRVY
uniref:MARVEL domain-containing protein n=1 Tax=Parastrongyloides trichosuri TaxID=131310 RepID=A0A0N4ZTL8_PARTI